MKIFFTTSFIVCIIIITMAACFSPSAQTPTTTSTSSSAPASSLSTPAPASENIEAGSMKPFYDITINYDPSAYSIDAQNSDQNTIGLLSTDENNDYALFLYHQDHKDQGDKQITNMDIANSRIEQEISKGYTITDQAKEIEIGGEKWVCYSSNITADGQTMVIDNYVCYYNKGYYMLKFATDSENYTNMQEQKNLFLQRITYGGAPSSEPLNLSAETLTGTPAWETSHAEFQDFSFEIPASWVKLDEYSTQQAAMYAPSGGDTQTSNIVVEARKTTNAAPSYEDLKQSDVLDIVSMTAPKAINVNIGDCYKVPLGYVLTASFGQPDVPVTQTEYIFLLDGYMLNVYTTDFGDGVTPELEVAVKHVIGTMKLK